MLSLSSYQINNNNDSNSLSRKTLRRDASLTLLIGTVKPPLTYTKPLQRHGRVKPGCCFCVSGFRFKCQIVSMQTKTVARLSGQNSSMFICDLFGSRVNYTTCLYQACQQQNEAIYQKIILIQESSAAPMWNLNERRQETPSVL